MHRHVLERPPAPYQADHNEHTTPGLIIPGQTAQAPEAAQAAGVLATAGNLCTLEAIFSDIEGFDCADGMSVVEEAELLLRGATAVSISRADANRLNALGKYGVKLMAACYGTGAPYFVFGPADGLQPHHAATACQKILWHNTARHAHEVGEDARQLAKKLGLGSLACHAFAAAGNWHDIDQSGVIDNPALRDGRDELSSAQLLIYELHKLGMDRQIAYLAAYFIMGTQVVTNGQAVVGQFGARVERSEVPSDEAFAALRIGACADLGRLYENPPAVSCGLFAQRLGLSYPAVPDLGNPKIRAELMRYLTEQQLIFLSGYRYPLPEAERLFAGRRDKVVAHLRKRANDGEAGLPATWENFIEQEDKAFACIS